MLTIDHEVAMSPDIQMENKVIIPSSFLFWLACAVHCALGYPYSFEWWLELLMWGAFLFPFVAIAVYAFSAISGYASKHITIIIDNRKEHEDNRQWRKEK